MHSLPVTVLPVLYWVSRVAMHVGLVVLLQVTLVRSLQLLLTLAGAKVKADEAQVE